MSVQLPVFPGPRAPCPITSNQWVGVGGGGGSRLKLILLFVGTKRCSRQLLQSMRLSASPGFRLLRERVPGGAAALRAVICLCGIPREEGGGNAKGIFLSEVLIGVGHATVGALSFPGALNARNCL